jgi:hypothetical protein
MIFMPGEYWVDFPAQVQTLTLDAPNFTWWK